MQNSGVNPSQQMYYQQTQGSGMMMGYPPSGTGDQRQQQQQQMMSMPSNQMYSGGAMQGIPIPGRPYSAGASQDSSGMRPPSHSQPAYQSAAHLQSSADPQQPQFQNRSSFQSQPQIQQPSSVLPQQQTNQRTSESTGDQPKKEETKAARPMNPPPYSPEILDNLSKFSVASLTFIGRELVQELLLRTYTLMTILTKPVDRWHQQQGISDPEQLLSYCEYVLSKISEIRLRIDHVPREREISEDEFIALMTDPTPPQKPAKLAAKEETFEVQRQKLVKLNTALKSLDWMCLVSDPRFLKKADKN